MIRQASLAEQHRRIVAEVERLLSVADETEREVHARLARAKGLRQAVLEHAFEGKFVLRDPNDEPASVLLERIRGARDASEARGSRTAPRRRARRAARRAAEEP
jgi:type I restriction enzyme S subunit